MKFASILIVLIFNWILWATIKTTPTQNSLARKTEKKCTAAKILSDDGESSVNPQIQKYKEMVKPKLKNSKKDTSRKNKRNKVFDRSEYNKEYNRKNNEKRREYKRNYYKSNKEKCCQLIKTYYQNNKEKLLKNMKTYRQNNKEKRNEYERKCRQEKKKFHSDNNEGTSFVNPQIDDFINKGKLSIVCEEKGNLYNQREEECYYAEDEQNQIEVEEPNKILKDNTIDLNNKIHPFDLNEKPDYEEIEDY
ncbi:unnamed protein product [Meloidogyne enterolobii]|uniref:Uncharacterized protein n=1 Tax=Meloidogyne enterolobii TaxID=390850 RepID=A0ACB1A1Y9_MELEN